MKTELNTDQPLVCICIPTYNSGNTISETLESLIVQTYQNLNILIVDNASTDNTLEIVGQFKDVRIQVFAYHTNIGAEGNFNRCIQLATGKYTAIYHADDIYHRDIVRQQIALLESNPNIGAVATEANLIDQEGNIFGQLTTPKKVIRRKNNNFEYLFKAILQYSNFIVCPSVMVLTTIYQQEIVEWQGKQFKTSSDLDVWLRISQKYDFAIIQKKLINYRISISQHSQQLRMRTVQSDFFRVIDHYLDQEEVKSFLCKTDFAHYNSLLITDQVVRSLNLYLLDRNNEAYSLCKNIFNFTSVLSILTTKRNFITFLLGLGIWTFILLDVPSIGKPFFRKIKKIFRK